MTLICVANVCDAGCHGKITCGNGACVKTSGNTCLGYWLAKMQILSRTSHALRRR
ncbi:MAG: hypothetical protein E6Q51_00025 [Methylophilus methylotrophus]|uniref:Uncharacterized protein n=1 Tax=Methylophilus methylotrophus TaxID=17 RepID=A0A5C7WQI1_METME|nr:MAG: hypothetical protein E6Q51_00025 [Methylophilus methylotrophus]